MLVVALDTSTPAVSAALVQVQPRRVVVKAQHCQVDAMAHGELLAPALARVLAEGGASTGELAAAVAGIGPGPFTGLRVGLATAAALAHALGIPGYGVCSLDAIGAQTTGVTLVATDARRREVYWAVYHDGLRIHGPAVGRPAGVAQHLEEAGLAPRQAVGAGALLHAGALGLPVSGEPRYPDLASLVNLAAGKVRTGAAGEHLGPLYLRRPDAVEPAGVHR